MNKVEFHPDWASAPGDTIIDILNDQGISEMELAQRIGYSQQALADLLQGRATITIATAQKLERVLGASMQFWMSRDFQYRRDAESLSSGDQEWLAELPIGDMIRFGGLAPIPRPSEELAACLRYFGVLSVANWMEKYSYVLRQQQVAFRSSHSFDSRPASVVAWLRQGEIGAEAIECNEWDAGGFKKSLLAIRELTRQKDPKSFLPVLRKLCAENGVAIVVARAPSGCRASGATRFLRRDKALLMLSFRYLSDDQFWFTFFHEAGHLILHGENGFFLEGSGINMTQQESEANKFSQEVLIPPEWRASFLALRANTRDVIRFAVRLRISPGIVVGQMQFHGKINHTQLNRLKRRFKWES